jgi:hypothetical protein
MNPDSTLTLYLLKIHFNPSDHFLQIFKFCVHFSPVLCMPSHPPWLGVPNIICNIMCSSLHPLALCF